MWGWWRGLDWYQATSSTGAGSRVLPTTARVVGPTHTSPYPFCKAVVSEGSVYLLLASHPPTGQVQED
jgi:hypothetical protein